MPNQWKPWAFAAALPALGMFACGDGGSTPGGDASIDAGSGHGGMDSSAGDGSTGGGDGDGDMPVGDGDGDAPVPCGGCAAGQVCDTTAGLCVGCLVETDCSGDKPRCNLAAKACVACLSGPDDNCGIGQYCDDVDHTCKVGCNPQRCASGVCEPDGDCSLCVADDECVAGSVCSTHECVATCDAAPNSCPDTYECCPAASVGAAKRCAALDRDPDNCKACGTQCTLSQFCGDAGCRENGVSNVCDALKFSFLLDGQPVDDAMANAMHDAFVSQGCVQSRPTQTIAQDDSNALNQITGQPVVGAGELVVVLGGPFGQHVVNYLEQNKLTKSYTQYDATTSWFYGRGTDGAADPAIITAAHSTLSAQHDFFVIETVTDPISRARVLKVYGMDAPGTKAAAWFFSNVVLANLSAYEGTHYIYEWTDDGTDGPSAGDTFTQRLAE